LPERSRPLGLRWNAVVSRNARLPLPAGVLRVDGLARALDLLDSPPWRERVGRVFVIGGASVFRQALAMSECATVHLTRVMACFHCDALFPELGPEFALSWTSPAMEEDGLGYRFERYQRCEHPPAR